MKIGVICPSEIAIRRFMPALQKIQDAEFVGVAICSQKERFGEEYVDEKIMKKVLATEREKAQVFIDGYGGKIFESYESIVTDSELDAIYIPLPPALHYKWARKALESGKHVLVEKPSTISQKDTQNLVKIAKERKLALHENYMFIYHEQLDAIDKLVAEGVIGEERLYRVSFGFPLRSKNDFRYDSKLGGGALIDAGGYTLKYASRILGDTAKIKYANMNNVSGYEVDMYGSAALINDDGKTVQVSFGMDNEYKCELEIWGSEGCIKTDRILTAPVGFIPKVTIRKKGEEIVENLPEDDSFEKSILYFMKCINDDNSRLENYLCIEKQAGLVEEFRRLASKN